FSHLVLMPDLASAEGYTSAETDETLLGERGVALSPLRPAGTAEIGGRRVDVMTEGSFVPAGEPVEVVSVRGSRVVVRPAAVGPVAYLARVQPPPLVESIIPPALCLAGLGLLAVEVYVMPGVNVGGVAGAAAVLGGVIYAFIEAGGVGGLVATVGA